jgi:hypothetical protein
MDASVVSFKAISAGSRAVSHHRNPRVSRDPKAELSPPQPRGAALGAFERFIGIDAQKTQAGIPACVLATPRPFDQGIGQPQPR